MSIIYICPGCFFLKKKTVVSPYIGVVRCNECYNSLQLNKDPKYIQLLTLFSKHNKRGRKCPNCSRFIPLSLNGLNSNISCPYFDCCFVGDISKLKRMNHPSIRSNIISSPKINVVDDEVKLLNNVIEEQGNIIQYNSSKFTIPHKTSVYQAFKNLLNRYPKETAKYLIHKSKTEGFQHKIFQEYISVLENSFPLIYKKGNNIININSLLDSNLNLFDGISTFESKISDKFEIKNNTKEFYIGGRKASYVKPYYIGKLLELINKNTGESLMNSVSEYSFNRIKIRDISPGTEVIVTHLRVPPHYQLGGMVYINRFRKAISDKINERIIKS